MTPTSRWVVAAALLLLGGLAARRLTLDYFPRWESSELVVRLATPASDPAEVARGWVEPIERRLQAEAEVEAVSGEVTAAGAELRLKLRSGIGVRQPGGTAGAERLAARLEPMLAAATALRPGASVGVGAARAGEEAPAVVWLPGSSAATILRAADLVREVPGVASVEVLGASTAEVAVEPAAGAALDEPSLAALAASLEGATAPAPYGALVDAQRRLPVAPAPVLPATGPPARLATAVAALPVRVGGATVPLGSLGRVTLRESPPFGAARRDGVAVPALLVRRDANAPLLPLARELARRLAALPGAHLEWSTAAALRALLVHLGIGLLAAAVLGGLLGWRRGPGAAAALAAAPLLAAAAVANGWWLAGVPVDLSTLVAGWMALAALLPLLARAVLRGFDGGRPAGAVAATLLGSVAVALGVALAPAPLDGSLAAPARAFAVALVASLPLAWLMAGSPARPPGRSEGGRLARAGLRDAGTVLLLAATAAVALAFGWGAELEPRAGVLEAPAADLRAKLVVPADATVAETAARAALVEARLRELEGVERTAVFVTPGAARVEARLASASLRPDRLRPLLRLARARLGETAAVEAAGLLGSEGGSGISSQVFGLRPEADDDGFRYRVLLRSPDLSSLELAYARLRERLAELKVRDRWIDGWAPTDLRLRLVPRPAAAPARVDELGRALARRAAPPPALRAPGAEERSVRLFVAGAPRDAMALPQARELLGRPLLLAGGPTTPLALVVLRPERVRSRVQRQDGHFVVPVELHPAWSSQELRLDTRRQWDGELARLRLPAAVELQRPALGRLAVRWRPEQLRLAAFAACLPLLLGALALVGVGRVGRAAAVLSPILLGVLAAAPLASRGGGLDERGLFALLAASGGALGALLVFGAELPEGARASGARVYAALRRVRGAPAAGALLAGAVLLVPTVGAGRAPWAAPLRLGGLAAAVAEGSAVLVLPALLVGARAWRRGRSPESRRARHPEVWHPEVAPAPVALRLEARSLVKHYPAQRSALLALVARRNGRRHPARPGVRALDKVTVTLEPGIVGLLGPNGAGKTTLLRILTGILAPTRGGVAFQGVRVGIENLADYRRQIGFLPQGFDAYPGFSAEQFLDYWARERGMRDAVQRSREIERLLVAVGLAEHAQRKVRDFSGGMRQRVGIARALLGAPAMLVVDEPTTGLDLEARRRFREALLAIAERRIIVFSTHIASDVEAVASRLLLLHGGRLRFDGEPRQLVERARGRVFEAIVGDADLVEVAHRYRVTSRVREREGVRVRAVVAPGEALPGAAVEPSLEEAYLAELHGGTSC